MPGDSQTNIAAERPRLSLFIAANLQLAPIRHNKQNNPLQNHPNRLVYLKYTANKEGWGERNDLSNGYTVTVCEIWITNHGNNGANKVQEFS
jgi:hypothetical protein